MKMKKTGKEIVAWLCVLTLFVGCIADWGIGSLESKAADTADIGYTELTFSDFGLKDYTYTGNGADSAASITSWDKVAINGTIALPATGGSYIRFGGAAVGNGVELKYGGADKLRMCRIGSAEGESEGLQRADMGYADTDTVAGKEIAIRLTFDAVDNGANYLVTLEGTGESGQKDIATMTLPKEKLTNYKTYIWSSASDKPVSIYSESIKTSKDTYNSEEPIQVTAVSRSGDWVGIFEESATDYTKETAKAWYSVADNNGTMYDMPVQAAGNYKVCLMMNESTVLLSKKITVEQYVEVTYTELTFSDFGLKDATYTGNGADSAASITSWDKVAINGTIALPATGGSYIRFGGAAVGNGVELKYGSADKLRMCRIGSAEGESEGLQRADMGYADTDTVAGKEISIRLTFDAVDNGANYLVTLEGTGESGQKDIATMTLPKEKLTNYKTYIWSSASDKPVSIYSESIKTSQDTYTSNDPIQVKIVSRSGDWVGIFEESATAYTKETAKAWYSVADYNGTTYDLPKQLVGNYKVCLMMNESTVLLSKKITVEQYVEKIYTELTFSDFGLKDHTYKGAGGSGAANITSWDKIAVSGTIALPNTGASDIRFGGNAVGKGVQIKYGGDAGARKLRMMLTADPNTESQGLQAVDMGYEDGEVANREIFIRLTFEAIDDGANYLVTLEGTGESGKKDKATMTIAKEALVDYRMYVLSNATDKPVSIYSVGGSAGGDDNADEEVIIRDTPLNPITSYKEVTFKDFLIKDGPIPDYAITGQVASLEGRVFKGIITFPEKGGGYLIVGGTAKNAWYGIRVGASSAGLYLFETANGSQRWEISAETIGRSTIGEALELWLTFTYVDEHNVYVGVYVDGKFCGEKLFKNLVQPFENKLLVYSPKEEMIIASAETAWNKLLNSKVNFAYWGFTDNWKEELAEICK